MAQDRHILSVEVLNKSGVLARIAGLFSGRGFNIESLAVGETEDPALSRVTLVTSGDEAVVEQIRKQLNRLIDVIKVHEFAGEDYVERDLLLLKVSAPASRRPEVTQIVDVFRGKIVDVGVKHLMIELSGPESKISALIDLMRPYGIKEMVRSGRIALTRGAKNAD
jgi:acetolactate synthase I/III small subunit